ncbi:MAG: zinc ribbon domain-containing protein [Oscillospiraceae bacterium]
MTVIERLAAASAQAVSTAGKAAGSLAAKGKKQVDLIALDNHLAKAQRQLGALIHSLYKTGQENTLLVKRYLETITRIEAQIEELSGANNTAAATILNLCPKCGAEVEEDALFCNVCGGKLEQA